MTLLKNLEVNDVFLILEKNHYNYFVKNNCYYLSPSLSLLYMSLFIVICKHDPNNQWIKNLKSDKKIVSTYIENYGNLDYSTEDLNEKKSIKELTKEVSIPETPLLSFFLKNFELSYHTDYYSISSRRKSKYENVKIENTFFPYLKSLDLYFLENQYEETLGKISLHSGSDLLFKEKLNIPYKSFSLISSTSKSSKGESLFKDSVSFFFKKFNIDIKYYIPLIKDFHLDVKNIKEKKDLKFPISNRSVDNITTYSITLFLKSLLDNKAKVINDIDSIKLSNSITENPAICNILNTCLKDYNDYFYINAVKIKNFTGSNLSTDYRILLNSQTDFFQHIAFLTKVFELEEIKMDTFAYETAYPGFLSEGLGNRLFFSIKKKEIVKLYKKVLLNL